MDTIEERIMRIDGQMEEAKMYANYWTHFATSPANLARNISDGTGRQLTNEEKIDYAFKTALSHIQRFDTLLENKIKLMKGEEVWG